MMDKFAIFDYAEKGALADYEKACMMHKLFQDEKSKAAMNDAFATAHEIRRLHVAEIDKMKAAEEQKAEEMQQAPQPEAQKAQQTHVVPLDYSTNIELMSGRRMNFHAHDKDVARRVYEFSKSQAKELPGIVRRVSLVRHDSDGSETVLASMDIG